MLVTLQEGAVRPGGSPGRGTRPASAGCPPAARGGAGRVKRGSPGTSPSAAFREELGFLPREQQGLVTYVPLRSGHWESLGR